MININIDENTRKITPMNIEIGYIGENKIEQLQFNIPDKYKKFDKKLCIKTKKGDLITRLFDDNSDIFTITYDLTSSEAITCSVEFFKDDDIIAKTSNLYIRFSDSVEGTDVSSEEPKVVILNDLISQVNNLDVDLDDTTLTITKKDGTKKSVDTKGEKGDKGEPGKFQVHIVDELPEIGENGVMYLIKKDTTSEEDLYNEYLYIDNKWNLIGNTHIDLTDYYTKLETCSTEQIQEMIDEKQAGVELTGTYEDSNLSIGLNDENGQSLSKINVEIPQYQEIHYMWDKTTGEEAIDLFQMVYSYYRRGKLLNVDLKDGNKMYKLTSISQPNSMGSQYWCQFRTIDWYTDNVDMVFLQTINAVLEVNGGIVNSIEVKESVNQFALVREYNGSKGALPVDNTKEYVPTGEYEPATKQYVDISHYKRMPGWTSSRTQVLKNVNGIPTWISE